MSLKFTEELCVMTMENDAKCEEELTCRFKISMRNYMNFELSTKKSPKFARSWAPFEKSIYTLFVLKKYRVVMFHETEE